MHGLTFLLDGETIDSLAQNVIKVIDPDVWSGVLQPLSIWVFFLARVYVMPMILILDLSSSEFRGSETFFITVFNLRRPSLSMEAP